MKDVTSSPAGTHINPRWMLRTESRPGARVTLYCFPHAGGGASTYRMWPQMLPSWVDVVGVQLPGRENRIADTPRVDVMEIADAIAADASQYAGRPYAVFGHSMGGLLAFEVGRMLTAAEKQAPLYLAISGMPHPPWRTPPESWSGLPDDELLAHVGAIGGVPPQILADPQLRKLILRPLRSDVSWLENYWPYRGQLLSCPLSVFAGEEDEDARAEWLEEWRQETMAEFRVRRYPGGHFYLTSQIRAVLDDLAADLSACLD